MLWVALATAIMLLSGELSREADDGATLALLLAAMRKSTIQDVVDEPRRAAALRALASFELGLAAYRRQLATFKACIATADGKYAATRADYDACSAPLESERARQPRHRTKRLSSGGHGGGAGSGRGRSAGPARGPAVRPRASSKEKPA